MSALAEWADARDGHYIDLDYYPKKQPYQCHDVWLDALVTWYGGTLSDGHAPGEGYTVAVWEAFPNHRPGLARLFTKHWGADGIRAGSVVFWPVGASNHPASHVALALGPVDQFGTFPCLSQNPGPARITRLSAHQVAGYLHPITSTPHQPRRHSMATVYYSTTNDKPGNGGGGVNPSYALAGDSPGTPANWIPTTDASVAAGWAAAHGNAVWLTRASFAQFKAQYTAPIRTAK